MSVSKISSRTVVTASPSETVMTVAHRMREHNVGTVVIVDSAFRPAGIVTDRDIVMRCVAEAHPPSETPVSVIMTREVRTVDEATPIDQALRTMAGAGTRRLVATGAHGRTVGILSMDDVVELLAEEAASIGVLLRKEAPSLPAS